MAVSRLFFALWPSTRVRAGIQSLVGTLGLGNARLVANSNTHVTLVFLGNVDEQASAALAAGAERVRIAPFSLCLDRLGWWRKPGIAWLAPGDCPPPLAQLAAELGTLATGCGLDLDKRPYRPHLTLARKVTQAPTEVPFEPIKWDIHDFCLLESRTRPAGVEYQVRARWPLKIM